MDYELELAMEEWLVDHSYKLVSRHRTCEIWQRAGIRLVINMDTQKCVWWQFIYNDSAREVFTVGELVKK